MKTNETANESVSETVNETVVETALSETQEQMLDPTLVTDPVTFDQVSEQWEAGENDDAWLLLQVTNGVITAEQFTEIRGLSVEEATKEEAKPEAPAEPMYSLDTAKEKIFSMIKESNGTLKAAGALAVVMGWHARHEITLDTEQELSRLLLEAGAKDGSIGGNNPPNPLDELLDELNYYKPIHDTLEAAKKDGENAIGQYIRENIKIEGTLVSRLIGVFSDIAYHAFKNKDLELVVSGDSDITKAKPYMGVTHRALWSYIKKNNMLGEVKENTVKIGDRTQSLGKTFDPYSDPSIAPIAMDLCKRAICYAFGHKTMVQFGYMPKRSINGRPSVKDVFESAVDDPEKYLRNLCIPARIVSPFKNQHIVQNKVGNEVVDLHLEGSEENDDESLVWFSNSLLEPVYQWLHGHELEYYNIDKSNSGMPDGSIKGSHDPRFPPGAQQRESSTKLLEKATAELVTTKASLDAALKGIEKENHVESMMALEAFASNKNMPIQPNSDIHALALALVYIKRICGNGGKPSPEFLKALLALKHEVDGLIDERNQDKPLYKAPKGDLVVPIAA